MYRDNTGAEITETEVIFKIYFYFKLKQIFLSNQLDYWHKDESGNIV